MSVSTVDRPDGVRRPASLTDTELIAEVARLAGRERGATADLIRSLMEFDSRRLYLGEGYPSLFTYCTGVLHYSEHAALNRIEVARAASHCPGVLTHIEDGSIHLSGMRVLAPHLTIENCEHLLASARNKTKREIEEIVAALCPRRAMASAVRRLPSAHAREDLIGAGPNDPTAPGPPRLGGPSSTLAPISAEHYRMHFTISRETREKLRRVQDLLRHVQPDGDPAVIFDRALTVLLKDLERKRFAATSRPAARRASPAGSRHIPAAVKREVWTRDEGRCAFMGTRGRCSERAFLEFHHVVPYAAGGEASASNIELRCRAHNAYEAALAFGIDPASCTRRTAGASGG